MVKIEIIAIRGPLSLEAQRDWWLLEHAPIARRMPGLRKYVINLAERDESGGVPLIYGTDHLVFDTWDEAMTAYASPEWRAARDHTLASGIIAERTWVTEYHVVPSFEKSAQVPGGAAAWREVPGVRMCEQVYRNAADLRSQQEAWLNEVAPLVGRSPGLRGYLINLSARAEQASDPILCGTAEMLFDSHESAYADYASVPWAKARALVAASGAKVVRTWCRTVVIML